MSRVKKANFSVRDIAPFEHLEFCVENTTPAQRLRWLEMAWNFWRKARKTYPKRILKLQDKFRSGEI
jgi:hypothetical protein